MEMKTLKNTFIAAFCAVFFFAAVKAHYRLLNRRFFGIEFRFWASKKADRFQFILVKKDKRTCTTSYGTKRDFSFFNLFKDIRANLNIISKREREKR